MVRPRLQLPTYRHHKKTGQAIITVRGADGKRHDYLLGKHGSKESKAEYRRICKELETSPAAAVTTATSSASNRAANLTIAELIVLFWTHAERYYVKPDGTPSKEQSHFDYALAPVRELYDHTHAVDFGPLALKAVQQRMVSMGWCRRVCNQRVGRIKIMFKWAASEQLIPVGVYQSLLTVNGLRKGKTEAKDHAPIKPVDDDVFDQTLPHCRPAIAAMLKVMRYTGCRPGEVVVMRPCDLDMTGPAWTYKPLAHKGSHADRARTIFIGPRGQMVLKSYLADIGPEDYVFSPLRERAKRFAEMRAKRKSKMQPSQIDRSKPRPKRMTRPRYDVTTLCRHVATACKKAKVTPWFPYMLRHSFGTEIRKLHGLDAAQVLLGHARCDVTQVYAELNHDKAAEVARMVG